MGTCHLKGIPFSGVRDWTLGWSLPVCNPLRVRPHKGVWDCVRDFLVQQKRELKPLWNLSLVYSVFLIQGHIGEALDEFHQAMRSAAEQQEIALICQYEIGQRMLEVFCNHIFFVIGLEICKSFDMLYSTYNNRFNITCSVLRPIRIRLSSCHPIVSVCHFPRVLPFLPLLSPFPHFVTFPLFVAFLALYRFSLVLPLLPCFVSFRTL